MLFFYTVLVTRKEHEACLARISEQCTDREAGIYGPGSMFWRMSGEAITFLGAGRAVLLQLAHPYVAYAIAEHSVALTDARKRFQGTFNNILGMGFGPLDEALASARGVYAGHCRVHGVLSEDAGRFRRGDRYHANDKGALLWVHATLFDTALRVHELVGVRMTEGEKLALYAESKTFALLFGLDDAIVPPDLAAFERYMADMLASDTLAVTTPARRIAEFLMRAPTPALGPAFGFIRAVTAQLLPPRLRAGFSLRFDRRDRLLADAGASLLRSTRRVLPESLRVLPEYMQALQRIGLRERSPISEWVENTLDRALRLYPKSDAA